MYWIVFGLLAGLFSYFIDAEPQEGGFMGAIILGVLGSIVGGLLADLFFGGTTSGFNMTSFVVAGFGSLMLLFVGKFFREA